MVARLFLANVALVEKSADFKFYKDNRGRL